MINVSAHRDDALPRWLARACADLDVLARRQRGLVAGAVVRASRSTRHLRVRLAARHAAPTAVRPVHALRLEGADPGLDRLDPRRRDAQGRSSNEYATDLRTSLLWVSADPPRGRGARVPARRTSRFRGAETATTEPFDPFAGGFPVPPLPGQETSLTRRAKATVDGDGRRGRGRRGRRSHRERGAVVTDERRFFRGFGVTFGQMFKKVTTEQYPEDKRPTQPRYHGRHQLNRHPDGLEKCIGCELCAWACPADAIYVEGAHNTDAERFSPGERYGRVYQINYLRCIFCGLCIEACPTRALTMTNEYELADDNRADLIFEKQDLLRRCCPAWSRRRTRWCPARPRRTTTSARSPALWRRSRPRLRRVGWAPGRGRRTTRRCRHDHAPRRGRHHGQHRRDRRLLGLRSLGRRRCARHGALPQGGAQRAVHRVDDDQSRRALRRRCPHPSSAWPRSSSTPARS